MGRCRGNPGEQGSQSFDIGVKELFHQICRSLKKIFGCRKESFNQVLPARSTGKFNVHLLIIGWNLVFINISLHSEQIGITSGIIGLYVNEDHYS